jgi:hypothetical protein
VTLRTTVDAGDTWRHDGDRGAGGLADHGLADHGNSLGHRTSACGAPGSQLAGRRTGGRITSPDRPPTTHATLGEQAWSGHTRAGQDRSRHRSACAVVDRRHPYVTGRSSSRANTTATGLVGKGRICPVRRSARCSHPHAVRGWSRGTCIAHSSASAARQVIRTRCTGSDMTSGPSWSQLVFRSPRGSHSRPLEPRGDDAPVRPLA